MHVCTSTVLFNHPLSFFLSLSLSITLVCRNIDARAGVKTNREREVTNQVSEQVGETKQNKGIKKDNEREGILWGFFFG
ncbi:hypothetical protein F4703DRAFT_1886853 [Phycomyces blakesleeanus]